MGVGGGEIAEIAVRAGQGNGRLKKEDGSLLLAVD